MHDVRVCTAVLSMCCEKSVEFLNLFVIKKTSVTFSGLAINSFTTTLIVNRVLLQPIINITEYIIGTFYIRVFAKSSLRFSRLIKTMNYCSRK